MQAYLTSCFFRETDEQSDRKGYYEEGGHQAKRDTAARMKAKGYSVSEITELTSLSEAEANSL